MVWNKHRVVFALLMLVVAMVWHPAASIAAPCPEGRSAPAIDVHMAMPSAARVGEPVEIRWSSTGAGGGECRAPLYLVVTTTARIRLEGEGFLAMPPGAAGPYAIPQERDRTRVFIPLHALGETASGSFKVKFYSAGANSLSWFVAALAPGFQTPAKRAVTVVARAGEPARIAVETGRPAIIVRDAFAPDISTAGAGIEAPRKRIVSNSGAFELQIFETFYRVHDLATGRRAPVRPRRSVL